MVKKSLFTRAYISTKPVYFQTKQLYHFLVPSQMKLTLKSNSKLMSLKSSLSLRVDYFGKQENVTKLVSHCESSEKT